MVKRINQKTRIQTQMENRRRPIRVNFLLFRFISQKNWFRIFNLYIYIYGTDLNRKLDPKKDLV